MTLLGTGTSQGVPVIGCDCQVCRSVDPRDHRLRCSALLSAGGFQAVIDTGPDFRQQMLRARVNTLDAVLLTHEHNDHIIGLDDVRPFNFRQWKDMPVFAHPRVQEELKARFAYVFATEHRYPGAPMIHLETINAARPFTVGPLEVIPVEVMHGKLPVLGFRIGDFAYLTDMRTIRPEELAKVRGVRHLVVSALHHQPHHSHMNLEQALGFIADVQPEKAYLIHTSHNMGRYEDVAPNLPPGVMLAYDGLEIRAAIHSPAN